jgi:hypothetical protein
VSVEFDVFHDGQFWVGVLTLTEDSSLRAARVVFGAEPSDAELHDYLLRHGDELLRRAMAGPSVDIGGRMRRPVNPKRVAREAAAAAKVHSASTAAQDALRQAQEVAAQARFQLSRDAREVAAERKRAVRRARAKARHRGH